MRISIIHKMLTSPCCSDTAIQASDAEIDAQADRLLVENKHPSSDAVRVLQSDALLQGGKRVHIAHNGACYQLQATRQGKLILTK